MKQRQNEHFAKNLVDPMRVGQCESQSGGNSLQPKTFYFIPIRDMLSKDANCAKTKSNISTRHERSLEVQIMWIVENIGRIRSGCNSSIFCVCTLVPLIKI